MTAIELRNLLQESGATDTRSLIQALEDGATLAALGVTDADQDAVEELHSDLMQGNY